MALIFFHLFLLSSCTCFSALLGSHRTTFYMFFSSAKERDEFSLLCMNFFVLPPPSRFKSTCSSVQQKNVTNFLYSPWDYFCSAAAQQVRNLSFSNSEHDTIHWHRFKCWKGCDFFCEITLTVKKSNPSTEPHGSPQGFTVRPRKAAGQSSIGGGGAISV